MSGAPSRAERIAGGLLGLLVGDALGVPYEFHAPENLPRIDQIELDPPEGFVCPSGRPFYRSHEGVPPGTWSDDGAHALCLLASLLRCGRLDLEDLSRRLLDWWHHAYLAVDRPFDVGSQTSEALLALERGVPPERSGPSGERDNGNGALMRVLPLALWHQGSDRALLEDALRQGLVTHGHPRSGVCCALYCLWARALLGGASAAEGFQQAASIVRSSGLHREELDLVLSFGPPRGSGYAVDTLHTARAALEDGPYERVVKRAIAFGLDTDTSAAVAGGLAGVRDGLQAIPERWLGRLRGRALVDPLLTELLSISAS